MLEPFLGKSAFSHHGQRVVEGQQLTQAASDIMLGWLRSTDVEGVDRDFYLRQLWDSKGSAAIETMNPKTMAKYAKVCGWALAKSHARSGDAIAIASYLGTSDALDRALAAFAETYAEQNDRDYPRSRRRSIRAASRRKRDCRARRGGFAEVHHVRLLYLGETVTRLEDLVVLCANCHRIAHRMSPLPTLAGLRATLR